MVWLHCTRRKRNFRLSNCLLPCVHVYIIQVTHRIRVDMAEKEKEKVLTSLADVQVGMKLEAMDKYGKW